MSCREPHIGGHHCLQDSLCTNIIYESVQHVFIYKGWTLKKNHFALEKNFHRALEKINSALKKILQTQIVEGASIQGPRKKLITLDARMRPVRD